MRGIHTSLVAHSRSFLLETIVILFVFPHHERYTWVFNLAEYVLEQKPLSMATTT